MTKLSEILETIARDGLDHPQDLDIAIDSVCQCYPEEVLTEDGFDLLADMLEGLGDAAPYRVGPAERDALVDIINDIFLRD